MRCCAKKQPYGSSVYPSNFHTFVSCDSAYMLKDMPNDSQVIFQDKQREVVFVKVSVCVQMAAENGQ